MLEWYKKLLAGHEGHELYVLEAMPAEKDSPEVFPVLWCDTEDIEIEAPEETPMPTSGGEAQSPTEDLDAQPNPGGK